MTVGSVNTAGIAYSTAPNAAPSEKPKTDDAATGKGWTIEDVVDLASSQPSLYGLTYRGLTSVKMVHLAPQSRHAGKAVILEERELTEAELYRLQGGPAGTMGVMGLTETSPDTRSRKVLEDFADRQPEAFETFVRERLAKGDDAGTDFKEAFFYANAGTSIFSYQELKAADDQWALAMDKAGRYLAQHGVDLNSPIALTRLDDGSYANVTDHPQKHYIEHLVNTNTQLFDKTWEQYHAKPGSIFL